MIHEIFLHGEIKKIQVSTPKESKDPSVPKKDPSAVLLVQYGVTREATGNPVEFVNAVQVRVPSYLYPKIADKLKEGKIVQITGHLQGVFKTMLDDGHFTSELVADRIEVEEGAHSIFLVGEIKRILVSTPKEPKDPAAPKKNPSAVLLVQYGATREATGNPVEFVNAVQVRVPSYLYPKLADKLKEGQTIQVKGHLQGVFKTVMDNGYFTAELVADRIEVEGEQKGRRAG